MATGNTNKIDEVVDSAAVAKQLSDLQAQSKAAREEFMLLLKTTNDLNNAISKATGNKGFVKAQEQAALSAEKLAQAQLKTQEATVKLEAAQTRQVLIQQRLEQQTLKNSQAAEKQSASQNKQAQAAIKAASAYEVLNAAFKESEALAKNVGAQYGINSDQFQKAAKSANFLKDKMTEVQRSLGNYSGNVGNYESGTKKLTSSFNGLGNAFTQITRELPAFVNSAQTGFLAISNNLPILFDEIKRVNDVLKQTNIAQAAAAGEQAKETALAGGASEEAAGQIGELAAQTALAAAEGQRGKAAFSAIAKSLFSFQTALSLGVLFLTLYGKQMFEFVASLFKGKDALDVFAEKQAAVNDAISSQKFKDGISNFYELKNNIQLAKDGLIDKEVVLNQYNETLGKTTGFADDFNEAEKLTLERGGKVIELLVLKASAQNLLAKASEKATERALELNKTELEAANFGDILKGGTTLESFTTLPGLFESTKDYNARVAKITLDAQKKLGAERRAQNAADLKKEEDQLIKAFQDVKRQAAEFAKANNLNFEDLVKDDKTKEKTGSGSDTSSQDELTALEYQYNQQIELARAKDKENLELEKEYGKQLENYRKEVFERLRDEATMDYAQRILANDQAKNADLTALADQYEQGLIKTKEYNERKNEIEQGYAQEAIKQQLQLAGDLIQVKKDQNEDTAKDEIELAKLQIRLSELVTAKKLSDLEKQKAKQAEINAAIKNLAEGAANFVIALVDAGFTNRKNQIAAEKDENDKRAQTEIDAVDRSLGTEQEKADKIAVIKAKQQSQNEAFARQQKKIDVEKAKFDKAVSIARIIENTAVGITSALGQFPPNVPLAVLIGALGAVQLGTVLAQPIPQYAKGTKNAKGGLSIIGEEGAEKVDLPNGKSFISASTAQLINLPAGAKVTPHGETMRMIGRPDDLQMFTGGQQVPWRDVIAAIERNKPAKSANNINIRIDGSFEKYRQNHFR